MRSVLFALCLLFSVPASAQQDLQRPIAALPSSVTAPAGQFTLFADYARAADGRISIYLVNRTDAPIILDTQDSDPYLVREVQIEGRWVRAEPFLSSFCGLSYYQLRIDPGHFIGFARVFPSAGEAAPVRYRLARQGATSNVGAGWFFRHDVRAAEHDALARQPAEARP